MTADFASAAAVLSFDLDADSLARFATYRQRIVAAGFNLTAVRDPERIDTRHFLESLAFGRLLQNRGLLADSTRLVDIGSGAGFPGLPLKLALPGLHLTLLEANHKRCQFLADLAAELALDNVTVLEGRAEALAHDPAHRETYDLALARAVAPLPVLLEYALPFLALGGWLAATKGSAAAGELAASANAITELGGELIETLSFQPPDGMQQTVVLVRKASPTPSRYPRRVGIPSKRPL